MKPKILLTGASGFLGSIILEHSNPDDVLTLGRHQRSGIVSDFSKTIPTLPEVDLVIHAAGKAHSIPKTALEKQAFFDVNVSGTVNILKGLMKNPPRSFVFISTVAVYGVESGTNINEDHPLSAKDPYGLSKINAEQVVIDWCKQHQVICTILRLPLLAGPQPPGNLGAMINGIKKGYYFNIDGGRARKSVVLAKDIAAIIPHVALTGGIYNLTDGKHPSFKELSVTIAKQLHTRLPKDMPLFIAKILAGAGNLIGQRSPINTNKLNKILADLTFDDRKARETIGWRPTAVIEGLIIK
jgi:nucleoside-diphosphate-sugar epimerase